MIYFFLGLSKSGKSLAAEQLAARLSADVAYVGTLPDHPFYAEIIREHRLRRPTSWFLYELFGSPIFDIDIITSAIQRHEVVLIDGLMYYIERILLMSHVISKDDHNAIRLFSTLLHVYGCTHGQEQSKVIIFVDTPSYACAGEADRLCIHRLHTRISKEANGIFWVEGGNEVSISRHDAYLADTRGN